MRGMKSAQEFYVPPLPGRYQSECVGATALDEKTGGPLMSKNGATMIKLTWEIKEGDGAGSQADDYIITDGTAKGGGTGKTKLRALGIDVDTDAEVPDMQIAQSLLGRRLVVEFGNEPKTTKESGYTQAQTTIDPRTGQTITLQKLTIKGYVPAIAAATGPAVQQYAGAPQYVAPQAQQLAAPQFATAQFPGTAAVATAPIQAPVGQQLQGPPPGYGYAPNGQLIPLQGAPLAQNLQPYGQPVAQQPAGWPPNGAAQAAAGANTTKRGKKAGGAETEG